MPPQIELFGMRDMHMFIGEELVEPGYSASDCFGIDLTGAVRVTNNINFWTAGVYTINYTVRDAGGNSARETREVFIVEREVPPPPPEEPTITIIGSNPIILHLGSETPYTEQGAIAFDEVDGDISANVVLTGVVYREIAGTYRLTYSITNSSGLTATATRDVRIVAPTEVREPRQTYNFSGQGKAGSVMNHNGVVAEHAGFMDLRATSVDNKSSYTVVVRNAATGATVYTNKFTAVGGTQFWVNEGTYNVVITMVEGNGNCKYNISVVTPEVMYITFFEDEVPLDLPIDMFLLTLGMSMEELLELDFTKYDMYECMLANGYSFEAMIVFGFTLEELIAYGDISAEEAARLSPQSASASHHMVRQGDTLWGISRQYYGTGSRWADIRDANRSIIGPDPYKLVAGMRLVLPE